jgi:hypothetical protein
VPSDIFHSLRAIRGYLKQKVFYGSRQKKTAVCLKIPVVVTVQNIEVFKMFPDSQSDAITHQAKMDGKPCDLDIADGFLFGQGGVYVAITGQNGRMDAWCRFQAGGNLKGLIGGSGDIGEERFDGA